MKTKLTVTAAVTSILLAGGAAHAAAIVPNSGDGSLLFFVTDTKTNQTYTDVLTQDVNSYFSVTQATVPAPTNGIVNVINGDAGFSVNLSTDTTLTGFLATAGADPLSYGIIGGAYSGTLGTVQRPTGKVRVVATSLNQSSVLTNLETQIVNAIPSGLQVDTNSLNLNLGTANSTNQGVFGTSVSSNGTMLNLYQGGLDMSGVALGSSVTLYGVSGNGTGSGATTAYSLGTAVFSASNDTLTFTGNGSTPVPLPAAVWLLGSGLLGLAGVGRRRAVKAA
ncbi:MAG TPA: VPLPA-CTERM sorting domain-containing protein [Steroidobacteraceae bacterium]